MVCLSRPYFFIFFRGCLPQILLGPFLNALSRKTVLLILNYHGEIHYQNCFWLTNFKVNNIQFPAHHETSVKTNKYQSVITKKFNLIFQAKSYHGFPRSRQDVAANQGLSNITRVIMKIVGVQFKYSLGTIDDSIFSLG